MSHSIHWGTLLLTVGIGCHLTSPETVPRNTTVGTGGRSAIDAKTFDASRKEARDAYPDAPVALPKDAGQLDQRARLDSTARDVPVDRVRFDTHLSVDANLQHDADPIQDGAPDAESIPDSDSDSVLPTGGIADSGVVSTGGIMATGGVPGTGGSASPCLPPNVFCEDFSQGMGRWTVNTGTWYVTDSQTLAQESATTGSATITAGAWKDQSIEARVRVLAFGGTSSSYRAELYARYEDPENFFAVSIRGDGKLGIRHNFSNLGSAVDIGLAGHDWHTLKLTLYEDAGRIWLEAYWDGALKTTASTSTASAGDSFATCGVGVYGKVQAEFDDFIVSVP